VNPKISTLIVDLDNTLYDWFEIWQSSFLPIYKGMLNRLGVDQADLDREIRQIHQRRRTSEYTFLVDELPFATPDGKTLRQFLETELAQSKVARDRTLNLYPTVLKTLWEIKNKGTRIIAYTESLSFYSAYRLKKLGLDGVIDILYSPEDHDLPAGTTLSKVRTLPDEFYQLQITDVRHTPIGELKPNPRLLREILKDLGAQPYECLYVGDSLFKDIAMAQDAGVNDAYAEYGASQHRPGYDLLRRVSHWTDEDVEREKSVTNRTVKPTAKIEVFSELLNKFEFTEAEAKLSNFNANNIIDIWKKVVDVQQHFNQIEIQIRNYALTVTGAIMAAGGITFRDGLSAIFLGVPISLSLGLALISGAVWGGFWFMDRHWYHRLLKGTVDHAATIETQFGRSIPEIALGKSISAASPINIFGFKLTSSQKIDLFYGIGAAIILAFAFFAGFATPAKSNPPTPEAPAISSPESPTEPLAVENQRPLPPYDQSPPHP